MSLLSSLQSSPEPVSTPSTISPSTSKSTSSSSSSSLSSSSSSSPSSSSSSVSSKCKLSEFYEVPLQGGRISKTSCKRREHKRTIAKLRRMLPYKQNLVECSELELINHIMDYIISLEEMLQSQENIVDENHSSTIDVTNLNRALSRFHLCNTNKRRPLRLSKQLCT
uniref:BHLH domain-containing protein n=1 Tax=Loa loa TaxID=7209 RepID=A0A1I7VAI1_LOALO